LEVDLADEVNLRRLESEQLTTSEAARKKAEEDRDASRAAHLKENTISGRMILTLNAERDALREGLEKCVEALVVFARIARLNAPLKLDVSRPLREVVSGVWPNLEDCLRADQALTAAHAILAQQDKLKATT
jgi:hypothetical protein